MPELPDITIYIEAIGRRVSGSKLVSIKFNNPFLLRTALPPASNFVDKRIVNVRRVGKRIALGFEQGYWLVIHLMIVGRLHWREPEEKPPGKNALLVLQFDSGILFLTEAGRKRRASVHLLQGTDALDEIDPGGLEPLEISVSEFSEVLTRKNHTLKRALTDPHLLSGIGNTYSDEILHRAKLSPFAMTQKLDDEKMEVLYKATQIVLKKWVELLRQQTGHGFPEKVTAFRPEMAVHGRFGKPCPVCHTTVQRIRYASNETNYCPRCQTDGKLLADRALSRLLKKDFPRNIEELE